MLGLDKGSLEPEDGDWRTSGTGMMAFYLSDLQRFGGVLPLARRHK